MIDTFERVLELIAKIIAVTGINLFLVAGIVAAAQVIKEFFKPSEKILLIIIFAIGLTVALVNIIFFSVAAENILVMAFGYPFGSIALYMFAKKKGWLSLKTINEVKNEKMDQG